MEILRPPSSPSCLKFDVGPFQQPQFQISTKRSWKHRKVVLNMYLVLPLLLHTFPLGREKREAGREKKGCTQEGPVWLWDPSSSCPSTEKGTSGKSHKMQEGEMLRMRTNLSLSSVINISSVSLFFFASGLKVSPRNSSGWIKVKKWFGAIFPNFSYAHTANFCHVY